MSGTLLLLAVSFLTFTNETVRLSVTGETAQIDPARSLFLEVSLATREGTDALPLDFRSRARGFSVAEEVELQPPMQEDGWIHRVTAWRLVPEPCASVYKIAPFAVHDVALGPILFTPPEPRDTPAGLPEIDPRKDFPRVTPRLVGWVALILVAAALAIWGIVLLIRALARRVREHRMSPFERAFAELSRLLQRGLPGRGHYKDFYVELTMVVRRYVQRKYGLRAPHLTTDEFYQAICSSDTPLKESPADLKQFLDSADLVKFAGVQATPEMADSAVESARQFLQTDKNRVITKEGEKHA